MDANVSWLAQVPMPTTPVTTPAPSGEAPSTTEPVVDAIRQACLDPNNPSWLCEWVGETTGSTILAGFAAWLWRYPPRIALILFGAFLVNRLARYAIKRSSSRVLNPANTGRTHRARTALLRATPAALRRTSSVNSLRTEARVQALTTVVRSVASVLIWFIALVACLQVVGFNFAPLVAISSVAGIALGFGAQNIVRDFLAGVFIILEDQFGVGDIVDIGNGATGTVEELTLRSTRVRDVDGTLWHVPNGQIQRVANKSQEWARAVLDIEVDGGTDYDEAAQVMLHVAEEMAAEEKWMADILAAPELWGVDAFTDAGYVIRMVLKTRPAAQFAVLRELRVRLIDAFGARGIVLPWAHWAVERVASHTNGTATPTESDEPRDAAEHTDERDAGARDLDGEDEPPSRANGLAVPAIDRSAGGNPSRAKARAMMRRAGSPGGRRTAEPPEA
jgi:moderate conductance mechanosensitive channel